MIWHSVGARRLLMSFLLFLLATAHPALPSVPIDTAPEGFSDAEAAAVLRFANSFIDEQGSTDHAAETARRCEEMIDTGNVQKAMRNAQVTYGLRTVEWK